MIRRRRRIHNKLYFCIGLFALGIGLAIAYFGAGSMTYRYLETRSWQPVEAIIHTLELKRNYGDTTSYKVTAEYSYVVDGTRYTNTRVALQNSFDNIGRFWTDLHRALKHKKKRDEVYAWVDPENPNRAVLDRSFRWQMAVFGTLFLCVFGVIGGGLVLASFRPRKTASEFIETAKSGLTSEEATDSRLIFYFGLLFFIVGLAFALMALPDALRDGEYSALFVLIFVAAGAGVMYFARRSEKLYKMIGKTLLSLDPAPGAIGGQVGGYFDVDAHSTGVPLQIRLTCYEHRRSGDETQRFISWQESAEPYMNNKAEGMRVTFVFDVPEGLPESKGSENRSSTEWEVECEGLITRGTEPLKLWRTWVIPMKKGAQTSRLARHIPTDFTVAQEKAKLAAARISAEEQIDIDRLGGDFSITSTFGRRIGFALNMAAVGTFFAVLGVFLIRSGWFPGYFFVVLGAPFALSGLFLMGRKITVVASPMDRILFMGRSWFRLPLYTQQIAYSDPAQFSVSETSSMTSSRTKTTYFALYVENNGKKVKVAEGIEGKDAAQALLDDLQQKLF